MVLPHERVFPIQIGSELFRLSGASLSSDAPSYFSAYFRCQLAREEEAKANGEEAPGIKTLYIDRDPITFGDIARHLQGYHILVRDGAHFVKLFADAQFYQLPRLISQLYEDNIYISIGSTEFHIPRTLFASPGNSPNFFTLSLSPFSPTHVFPGLDREGLLRPPSIQPPSVPGKSAEVFQDLVMMLKGYEIRIRCKEHREMLRRDARYYMFKGLEQKLVPHTISYNHLKETEEIAIKLEDVRPSGISVVTRPVSSTPNTVESGSPADNSRVIEDGVYYSRPFIDTKAYELVIEIGNEMAKLELKCCAFLHVLGDEKKRLGKLLDVVETRLREKELPQEMNGVSFGTAESCKSSLHETDGLEVIIDDSTSITLDGKDYKWVEPWRPGMPVPASAGTVVPKVSASEDGEDSDSIRRKRRKIMGPPEPQAWIIRSGQYRIRLLTDSEDGSQIFTGRRLSKCVLEAVKLEAFTGARARNRGRVFLS